MKSSLALFICCLLFNLTINGQSFKWVKSFNPNDQVFSYKSHIDGNGNFLVIGHCDDNFDFNPSGSNGVVNTGVSTNAYIFKTDSSGNFLWVKTISGNIEIKGITTDQQNNIYIIGYYKDTIDIDPGSSIFQLTSVTDTYGNMFIIKYDENCNLIWGKQFLGNSFTGPFGNSIVVDNIGNIYNSGYFNGTLDFDPGPGVFNLSNTYLHRFILKLNSDGDFIWAFKSGTTFGNYTCCTFDMTLDDSSNVYTVGYFDGSVDFDPGTGTDTLNSLNSGDGFVHKIDSSMNHIWVKRFNTISNNYSQGTNINIDNNGDVVISGRFDGETDFDTDTSELILNHPNPGNGSSIFISKLSGNGEFKWVKGLISPVSVDLFDMDLNDYNDIFLAGMYNDSLDFDPGIGIENSAYTGYSCGYILKLNENGEYRWHKNYGNYNNGNSSQFTSIGLLDKNIFAVGKFFDSIIFPSYYNTFGIYAQNPSIFILNLEEDSCFKFGLFIDSLHHLSCINNGMSIAMATGGILPFNFQWNTNPQTTDSIAYFANRGFYTVSVTDSINCYLEKTILIEGPTVGTDLFATFHADIFRPGFNSLIWLNGFNDGCVPVNGDLRIILDPLVIYNSSIPAPDIISGDTLTWIFSNLSYDSTSTAPIVMDITTIGQIGDTVCFPIFINPIIGDIDPSNNSRNYCFPVVNGYDPNDKQVYPQGQCSPNYTLNQQILTYTIRFQNTGNADAINIHIMDTLDPNLDLNSLRIVGSSHSMTTEILDGNVIDFRFDNIHLPDSGTNELFSHGYVIYEVMPLPTTPDNTLIENTSYIYFDYNPAIVTNTVFNTLVSVIPNCFLSSNENENMSVASIYPNPAQNSITVFLTGKNTNSDIEIYNLNGQLLHVTKSVSNSTTISLYDLASGIYFVRVNSETGTANFKLIKE